ncbi:MAG: hydroxyphenylacetyl-CoA thioesterase PaaI [Terriglobales bacterium]
MSTDPQKIAEIVGRTIEHGDQAAKALGVRLLEIRPGYARAEMKVRRDMLNSVNTCQGGVIFTLADTVFAFACNSRNELSVAAGCSIEFLLPGQEGDVLTAEGVERTLHKRTGVYDVAVTNQQGQCVALFRGKSHRTNNQLVVGHGGARATSA